LCVSCYETSVSQAMFNCPVCRQPGSGRDPKNRNLDNEPVLKALGLYRMCSKCDTEGFHSPEGVHSLCMAEEIQCLNAPACSTVCVRRDMDQHVRECRFHRCPLCLLRGTTADITLHHQHNQCPVAAAQRVGLQMMQTAVRALCCVTTNMPRRTVRQSVSALLEQLDRAHHRDMLNDWVHMSQQVTEVLNAFPDPDAPAAATHVVYVGD
jgi:hypothetical protein